MMHRKHLVYSFSAIFLLITTGYANQARFAGMGDMSFLFQDYFNRLDLYGFAHIPAGFFRHEANSNFVLRGSYLNESWELDSLTYTAIGQAIPQKLTDYAPVEAVYFYDIIPQFDIVPCEIIYRSSRHDETYDYFGNLKSPQAWGVNLGFSQLHREFLDSDVSENVRTPSFGFVYSRSLFEKLDFGLAGDGFYGIYNISDSDEKITLMPFGGGGGISYNTDAVAIGLNADYHYASFKYDGLFGSETFSGHALAPTLGSQVKFSDLVWVGAFDFRWVDLNGSANGYDVGELKITGYTARTQVLFSPSILRLAGYAEYDSKKPVYNDDSGTPWFETTYKSFDLGGGCGIAMARLNTGIEALYEYMTTEDLLVLGVPLNSNAVILKAGAEFSFVKNICLRGGYIYDTHDPNLDVSSDKSMSNTVTAGLGLKISGRTRIDIAYNYKWMNTDPVPDERVTDHIVFLFFNQTLVENEF
jgi:hypothetical protein